MLSYNDVFLLINRWLTAASRGERFIEMCELKRYRREKPESKNFASAIPFFQQK